MLDLRVRAHECLDEFRKGNNGRSGSALDALTPPNDNDELAILGGKTRLVKKEPGSPHMFGSPNTHNPVVPLPLSPTASAHPNVVEYLNSFQYQQQPTSASSNSYSDDSISPVSTYGLSALPANPIHDFHPESSGYQPATPTSQTMLQSGEPSSFQQQHQHSSSVNGSSGLASFPQYFPVYDYGSSFNREQRLLPGA